jgi:predicted permease
VRDEALDELADLHELRAARDGRAAADRWYRLQLPGYALRLRVAAGPGGPLQGRPVAPPPFARREPMGTLLTEIRHAARSLRRSPAFSAVAILTLALGIGANAAIFSVVRTVLLRPLPFREPERLVALTETREDRGIFSASFTHDGFWDVRDLSQSLQSAGALEFTSLNLVGLEYPERLNAARTSSGFFGTLGVTPVVGRLFAEGEDQPGGEHRVALLSHRLWATRFGSDSTVVGRALTLDGESHRVVGVLPPGASWLAAASIYVPLVRGVRQNRGSFELAVVARLRSGVSLEAANAELDAVGKRLAERYPEMKGMGVSVEPSANWVASDSLRRALWVLMGAVGFLLLIACVNLANLLLARANVQTRERAMRVALGASRGRVARLALTESALIGLLGGVAGLGLALAVVRVLRGLDPGDIPRLGEVTLDGMVLAATLGASLLTSLVTGLLPALRATDSDLVTAIREGERSVAGSRRAGRVRGVLVTAEVALSLILLVGAGLLIRSFARVLGVDRGFAVENRVVFDVGLPTATSANAPLLLTQVLERVGAIPEVRSVAAVSMRPMRGVGTGLGFAAADKAPPPPDAVPWASWRIVSGDYFRAMGVPLLSGRPFTGQDQLGRPWRVIISRRIARQLWGGDDPVGRRIILWKGQDEVPAEVIGVAGDVREWGLTEEPAYAVYLPFYGEAQPVVNFVVHSSLPPQAVRARVQAALARVNPELPVSAVMTLEEIVGRSVASRRFTMVVLATLSAVALLLAMAGVYGVLAYAVSRRRAEIGTRLALGATNAEVTRMVVSQGMRPVAVGLIFGVAGALALSRFMASLLFGVTTGDWPTYAGVAALLTVTAALSCYLPTRDALRVDLVAALREE